MGKSAKALKKHFSVLEDLDNAISLSYFVGISATPFFHKGKVKIMKDKFSCGNDQAENNASLEPNETPVDQGASIFNMEYQPEPELTDSDTRSEASDFQVDQVHSIGNFDLTDPVLTDGCALHEQSVDSSSVQPPEKAPKKKRSGRPSKEQYDNMLNRYIKYANIYGERTAYQILNLSDTQLGGLRKLFLKQNIQLDHPSQPNVCSFSDLSDTVNTSYPNFAKEKFVRYCIEDGILKVTPITLPECEC
jgi:hypothetical protein